MKKITICLFLAILIPAVAFAGAFVTDSAYDAALDYVATATRLDITSDTSTPANLDNTLGNVTVTAGDGNGDFTIANGDTSGRKLTVSAQEITATGSGTAKHWVLSVSGTILATGTVTDKSITSSSVYEFPATNVYEVRDAQ